jgi:hypothetical protein
LALITEILRLRKDLNYNSELYSARGTLEGSKHSVDANVFNCLAPLYYLEKTRKECPHEGRCREEGLLLALLTEKRNLEYGQKIPIGFPRSKPRFKGAKAKESNMTEAAER